MRGYENPDDGGGRADWLKIGAIIAFALISLGIVKIFMKPAPPHPRQAAEITGETVVTTSRYASTILQAKERVNAEKKRKALVAIAEHEKIINRNFGDPETSDRLMGVGNLYQYQLGDYYSAIQSYRTLVDSAPNHSQAPQAFVEIATCYERLGEEAQAMYVYQEMVEKLNPSLQHVQFAKLKLEGG